MAAPGDRDWHIRGGMTVGIVITLVALGAGLIYRAAVVETRLDSIEALVTKAADDRYTGEQSVRDLGIIAKRFERNETDIRSAAESLDKSLRELRQEVYRLNGTLASLAADVRQIIERAVKGAALADESIVQAR